MYNRISELDKSRILNYISYNCCSPQISLKKLLTPWAEAKSEYLGELFGNNLIIKEEVSFAEGYEEIFVRYEEAILEDYRCDRFLNDIRHIYNAKNNYNEYWLVNYAVSEIALINNKITEYLENGTKRRIIMPDNTVFTVSYGMKPMKLITKLANAYHIGISTNTEDGVSDLEHFRRKHSLLFNNKELKGELCLSIHPLDYMTMSDNNCDWETCMSWENSGEYKQGTVEMMNSPSVVVAYLTSSDPYCIDWDKQGYDDFTWNNKKWRCLFIVDKDFIMSIKQYPYYNKSLVCAAAEKIAEISGWGKCKAEEYTFRTRRWGETNKLSTGQQVFFDFQTGAMYNDFGSDDHFVIVNPNVQKCVQEYYCYSGVSECMCCGETAEGYIGRDTGPEYLLCTECEPRSKCSECGCVIREYESGWTTEDGYYLCEDCFDNRTEQSDLTEAYWYGALNTLYLSTSNEEFGKNSDATIRFAKAEIKYYEWKQCFKCDEPAPHPEYYGSYYVTPDQCTEKGLELFEIQDEDDLKDYMGLNEDN